MTRNRKGEKEYLERGRVNDTILSGKGATVDKFISQKRKRSLN